MASKEFRRADLPADRSIKIYRNKLEGSSDPLFDRDWEVFVVKRDQVSGELTTETACCDEHLSDPRPLVTNRLSFC